jgi:ABC-type phosphate/phosphonate transport system substrate-binding protein
LTPLPRPGEAGPGQRGQRPSARLQVGVSWSVFFAGVMESYLSPTPPTPASTGAVLAMAQDALKRFLEARTQREVDVETLTLDGLIEGLDRGDYDLGLVAGVDYATLAAPYPNLQPLVFGNLGRRVDPGVTSHVIVRAADRVGSLADLKGKALALSRFTRYPDLSFLRSAVAASGQEWIGYFTPPKQTEKDTASAIDDVVSGDADLAVVSGDDLASYRLRHPGKARRLAVLADSDQAPAPVILYNQKATLPLSVDDLRRSLITGRAADLKTVLIVRAVYAIQGFGGIDQSFLDLLGREPDDFENYRPTTLFYGW